MYGVTFLNRDFTLRTQPAVKLTVESLQYKSPGGPSLATFSAWSGSVRPSNLTALTLVELLRCPVQVWNNAGRVVWWGYLAAVEFAGVRYDLASMANHVQAMYTFSLNEGVSMMVQHFYTAWASDLGSQADYGIKEKILSVGGITFTQAVSRLTQYLRDFGRPKPAILPDKSKSSACVLTCRGWWDTLNWKYYANPAGLISYTIDGVGIQFLDASTCSGIAESFQATTTGWSLDTAWLKLSKAGAPLDNLECSIYADVTASPGGSVLSSGSLAGSGIGLDYSWVKFALSPALTVGAGVYWLVLTRSGGPNLTNFYKVKVNESCGYSKGALKINAGSWGSRLPDADLNFTLLGKEETTAQLVDIAATAQAGQFLAGTKIEDASALFSSPYRSGAKTGLQEIRDILASGNSSGESLVASVDAQRCLHVRRKAAGATLTQTEDGIIKDAYGQAVPEDEIAGRWVKIERPGVELPDPQFITQAEVGEDGKVSLKW